MEKGKKLTRLLLLACSERKVDTAGPCAAIDLYDGPSYRILRKKIREGAFPDSVDVAIVSGKYGLIPSSEMISPYDQRISREVVDSTGSRERMREMVSRYDEVFVNMGADYMAYFQDMLSGAVCASGRIGEKNSQMKAWLEGARVPRRDSG